MKKILLTACVAALSVCSYAADSSPKKDASEKVAKLAKLVELFRMEGTIQSKCGVNWHYIIHFDTPGEAVQDLREIQGQIDSACGTDKTFFVS